MCHSAIRLRAVDTTSQYESMLRLNPYLLAVAPLTPTASAYLKARLSGESTASIAQRYGVTATNVWSINQRTMLKLKAFVLKNRHWHPVYGSYRARMRELVRSTRYPFKEPEPMQWWSAEQLKENT